MTIDELTYEIIAKAIRVHTELGPGLLEGAYRICLVHALRRAGFRVETEVAQPIVFDGVTLGSAYKIDLLAEDAVIVEIKAVEQVLPVHRSQLLSYLRLRRIMIGLLINFHVPHLVDGVERIVNNYRPGDLAQSSRSPRPLR